MLVIETVISGLPGIAGGTIGYYYTNKLIEKNRKSKSTKREQGNNLTVLRIHKEK